MASIRVKPLFLTPSKTVLKVAVALAVVIFILTKLISNSGDKDALESTIAVSLDEKIQKFQSQHPNQQHGIQHDHHDHEPAHIQEKIAQNANSDKLTSVWNLPVSSPKDTVFVMIPFANVQSNPSLQLKFQTCVTTMSDLSSTAIVLLVVGDKASKSAAGSIVNGLARKNVEMHHVDLDVLGEEMKDVTTTMQQHFSYKPGAYYSHALFFLSIAVHRLAPPSLSRLIMLDADLKFKADVKDLNDLFDKFAPSNIFGIAHENQPVYRHILSAYRQKNPGTRVGDPPPAGLPGFNSGVLLMDLDRMRGSARYNAFLDSDIVKQLTEKYSYKGHLGDQDFYSLVSLENEDLFYVLPCTWNRQLCQWWRDKGYESVFDSYYACQGDVKIYHGNCNTPLPND